MDKKYEKLGNPFGDYSKELRKRMDDMIIRQERRDAKDESSLLQICPNHRSRCRATTTTRLHIRCVKMVNPGELYCFWHKPKHSEG